MFNNLFCRHTAVTAYDLNEKVLPHNCVAVLLLFADYLQQDCSRNVIAGLLVDNCQVCTTQDQVSYVCERDIAAFFRVIQAPVRIFFDDSGWIHTDIFGLAGAPLRGGEYRLR